MTVVGEINLERLKNDKKGGSAGNKLYKRRNTWQIKGKYMHRLYTTKMLHTQIGCINTTYIFVSPIFRFHNWFTRRSRWEHFYVPGAYLNADIPGEIFIVFKLRMNFWTSRVRWIKNIKKKLYGKWGKSAISMITESIVWMHGVHTNIIQPVF